MSAFPAPSSFRFAIAPPNAIDPARRVRKRTLHLYASSPAPATVVVSAQGQIDASNASDLNVYVRHAIGQSHYLVLDLSGLDFFGTEGLSVLHKLQEALTPQTRMAVVPSPAVTRLLQLCSPGSVLVIANEIRAAIAAVQSPLRPVLQLVAEGQHTSPCD